MVYHISDTWTQMEKVPYSHSDFQKINIRLSNGLYMLSYVENSGLKGLNISALLIHILNWKIKEIHHPLAMSNFVEISCECKNICMKHTASLFTDSFSSVARTFELYCAM
jgi:hypothetical protein